MSSALPVTLKLGRNALLGSDTLLKLMHLSLHSRSSQTLLEASSDWNTFCWCLCNATDRLGDRKHVTLSQRVRGCVRAVRAVRNTRVFLTETRVVADACPLIRDAANRVYPDESTDEFRDESRYTVPIQWHVSIYNWCRHFCPSISLPRSFVAALWCHRCELKMNLHPRR